MGQGAGFAGGPASSHLPPYLMKYQRINIDTGAHLSADRGSGCSPALELFLRFGGMGSGLPSGGVPLKVVERRASGVWAGD